MSTLLKEHLRFWVRLFWTTVFFIVILLAVLVQIGRTVFPVINDYRTTIESQLSLQLGVELVIGEIEAVWQGLRPSVSLNEVSILNDLGEPVFEVGQIDVEISLLKTVIQQRPSFRQLSFRQLEATLVQTPNHFWRVKGLPESTSLTAPQQSSNPPVVAPSSSTQKSEKPRQEFKIDDPLDIFLFGRRVQLSDTSLDFIFLNDLTATVVIPDIRLENDTAFHRLSASFAVDGGEQDLNLVVEGLGDPRDEASFEAEGFLSLNDFPVEKVLAAFGLDSDVLLPKGSRGVDTHQWQNEGRVDLNLWFNRKASTGLTWQGDISVDGVPFIPREGMVWPKTLVSGFSGHWQRQEKWQLSMTELDLRWQDFEAPKLSVKVEGGLSASKSEQEPMHIAVESLDAKEWHSVAHRAGFFSSKLDSILSGLEPQGILKNVQVDILTKKEGYFFLRSNVEEASVSAWQGVPAIKNVNGYLEASAFEGHLSLRSDNGFSLGFPKVYQHPLLFNHAMGDVRWQVDMQTRQVGVSTGQIKMNNDDVAATGHLNLLLPFKSSPGIEPEMTLSIGVEKGVASLHKLLVPYTVPKKLNEWLDRSIKEGVLTGAGFIYHGSLKSDNHLSRSIQFGASVQQAELKFDPSWPALADASGVLLLDDQNFKVTDLRGSMMGVAIDLGEVALVNLSSSDEFEDKQGVALKATVSGDSGKAIALLKETPIAHILGDELASWHLQGDIKGSLDLLVPFDSDSDEATQNIQLQLDENRLVIPSLNLVFDDVSGPFSYTESMGVSSFGLNATLWGQRFVADIETQFNGGDSVVKVNTSGSMDVTRLQQWSKRPELGFTKGVTLVSTELIVPLTNEGAPIEMNALSTLEGVTIDLPEPFKKEVYEITPLKTHIVVTPPSGKPPTQSSGSKYQYSFSYADIAKALVVAEGDSLEGVTVSLGDKAQADKISKGEINIVGSLNSADVDLWTDTVLRYEKYAAVKAPQQHQSVKHPSPTAPKPTSTFVPVNINVDVDTLSLGDVSFSSVSVIGDQTPMNTRFEFSSSDLSGVCTLFNDERPMQVNLKYLHLAEEEIDTAINERETISKTREVSSKVRTVVQDDTGFASVDVSDLPPMDFYVEHLQNGDRNFGSWSFKLRPISGGVVAYDLGAEILGLHVKGSSATGGAELIWMQSHGENETFFSGLVTASNVGPVMESWDLEEALTSDEAVFNTDVQWRGAPDEIALERLFGMVQVDLKRGRFIRGASAGENPFVKLIGLLNFDTLARRFRLDFSDLHPEGMSYDRVKGEFMFNRGIVKTSSPLLVSMPASDIQFLGDIDVVKEEVDAKLVVTLPLAGISTTAVAALTGGVPLAVGFFVVSKIFKRQVDQASSIRYRVKGTWEDPSVDLEKVFENRVQK